MKQSILYRKLKKRSLEILIFVLLTVVVPYTGIAQNSDCDCRTDFDFLHQKIKKTPAYKYQVKQKDSTYSQTYRALQEKVPSVKSEFECFFLLNKLLLSLNDNHMHVLGKGNGMTHELLKDSMAFAKFRASNAYTVLPKLTLDLDSLEIVLKRKSFEEKEGIYQRKGYLKIGVYWDKRNEAYTSVVLESQTALWQVGELYNRLIPFGKNNLRAIGGAIASKRLISYTERIQQGLFLTMRFQKDITKPNFSVAPYPESVYKRVELSPEITYLKIGSFNAFYPVLSRAETFYASIEGTLLKPKLIVDLRDNGGGGDRNSNILFKMLKRYSKVARIYILINQRTGSNAEQFTHKLMDLENIMVLGDRSRGVVAYEMKNSNYNLPSGSFSAQLTSKKHQRYLYLESKGILPEVFLDYQKSWITQVEAYGN